MTVNVEQEQRIKRLLAIRQPRENMTILARNLGLPYGTVASHVYGYRSNPEVQEKIAAYLGQEKAELFEGNGHEL
jgi:hypothetical protein